MDWIADAKCRGKDVNFFYDATKIQQAVGFCQGCSVKTECLQWALDHDEHGVWGGTTEEDRRARRRNAA